MHGLINCSIQSFVSETYGRQVWETVTASTGLEPGGFEAMMTYDDQVTYDIVAAASEQLGKPNEAFLEDLGTFLCSHPKMEAVRRLLRFGGETFSDFLCSLDDLADRVHLALPGLEMPEIDLHLNAPGNVTLRCTSAYPGFGHVMVGVLQAMSDDYGTLAMFEYLGKKDGVELISIQMLTANHSQGRKFDLSKGAV